jgi:hypothetical protein
MTYEDAARDGFEYARAIYSGKNSAGTTLAMTDRYKSSNKLHLNAASTHLSSEVIDNDTALQEEDTNYSDKHMDALTLHAQNRITDKIGSTFLDRGRIVRLSKPQALNCYELASVAAERAYGSLGKPTPYPIALAQLSAPADHVFTIVGTPDEMGKLDGVKIDDLDSNVSLSDDLYAVDPWLNILCHLRNYATMAEAKLKKWQRVGKRVYWGTGPLGEGWYAPEGKYSDGFAAATLIIILPG